eukprot:TRINITY_DN4095_c0_g1_i1.p1 TRINITY_DN4095_c0_g1~~TRINITY_DN4095_c0_g1_i1.p1  ORF type:complete len:1830 (+),score=137.85 TRINITY_DN4095_c0_g1_i1:619-5490(+)
MILQMSETSPIFLHLVSHAFIKPRSQYVSEDEKFERVVANLSRPASAIDMTIEMHEQLSRKFGKLIINFFISQIKSKDFKYSLAYSFIDHYPKIMSCQSAGKDKGMSGFSIQLFGMEDLAKKIFANEVYVGKFIEALKGVVDGIHKENIRKRRITMNIISHDLKYLLHPSTTKILVEGNFLKEYIALCSNYSFFARVAMLEAHLEYADDSYISALEIEFVLVQIFHRLGSAIDYTDTEYCKKIAEVFKTVLLKLYETAKEIPESYYNIPVHRFLAYFLVNYTHTRLLLEGKSMEDPEKVGTLFREMLKELFDLPTDKKYDKFVLKTIYPVLRTVGFYLEGFAKKWVKYGSTVQAVLGAYIKQKISFDSYDLSLCTLLLSTLGSVAKETLGSFLITSLSQADRWLSSLINSILDDSIDLKNSIESAGIDYSKTISLLEHFLFTLSGIFSNDCVTLPLLFDSTYGKYRSIPYHAVLKKSLGTLKSYAYQRYLLHSYFSQKQIWVPYKKMAEDLPKQFLKGDTLENELNLIAERTKDPQKGTEVYRIKEECINLYDPFFFLLQGRVKDSDEKAEEIYKKVKKHSKFNPLFGTTVCSGYALNKTVTKILAGSEIPYWLGKMLKRGNKGELSNNVIISVLKLMRCFKDEVSKEIIESWMNEVKQAVKGLKENMKEYEELLIAFEKDFGGSILPQSEEEKKAKDKETMKAKQAKIMEEFKRRNAEFAGKHKETLKEFAPMAEAAMCVVCKESLNVEVFKVKPYGVLFHSTAGNVYEHFVKQNVPHFDGHIDGLAISSCGHYMHFECHKKLAESLQHHSASLEELLLGAEPSVSNLCPLCKSPYSHVSPPIDCLQTYSPDKPITDFIENLLMTVLKSYELKAEPKELKEAMEPGKFIEILSGWLNYSVKTASLTNLFNVAGKKDIFLSLLFAAKWVFLSNNIIGSISEFYKSQINEIDIKVQKLLEGELIDHDILQVLVHALLLIKFQETPGVDYSKNLTEMLTCCFYMVLWQALIKCLLEKKLHNISDIPTVLNKEVLTEFIKANECEIKAGCAKWLQATAVISQMLFSKGSATPDLTIKSVDELIDYLSVKWVYEKFLSLSTEFASPLLNPEKILKGIQSHLQSQPGSNITIPSPLKMLNLETAFNFTPLQEIFTDCLRIHYKRKCKKCGQQVKQNALCLLCGEIVCPGNRCCSYGQRGELNYHSQICAKGKGIFLYFHENVIFLLSDKYCATYPSPYVNTRGESVDTSKKTFEILRLDLAKLDELKTMFLMERIPATVEARKAITNQMFPPGIMQDFSLLIHVHQILSSIVQKQINEFIRSPPAQRTYLSSLFSISAQKASYFLYDLQQSTSCFFLVSSTSCFCATIPLTSSNSLQSFKVVSHKSVNSFSYSSSSFFVTSGCSVSSTNPSINPLNCSCTSLETVLFPNSLISCFSPKLFITFSKAEGSGVPSFEPGSGDWQYEYKLNGVSSIFSCLRCINVQAGTNPLCISVSAGLFGSAVGKVSPGFGKVEKSFVAFGSGSGLVYIFKKEFAPAGIEELLDWDLLGLVSNSAELVEGSWILSAFEAGYPLIFCSGLGKMKPAPWTQLVRAGLGSKEVNVIPEIVVCCVVEFPILNKVFVSIVLGNN